MMKFSGRSLALLVVWLVTMLGALATGAYAHKYRAKIRSLIRSVQNDPAIMTNLYALRVQKVAIPSGGRDGGIAALGDGLLFANRLGELWFVNTEKALEPIATRIPVNVDDFTSDPFNANTLAPELFGVKDIAVQSFGDRLRVLASHSHWNRDGGCNSLRVSALETSRDELLSGGTPKAAWRTVFETEPCRPLELSGQPGQRMGLGAGGRIAPLPDGRVLLSVGGFDPENELVLEAPQKLDNSYGKSIWIDVAAGTHGIFTIGHRNPQGLTTTSTGQAWLTEHGARGGDELNLLTDHGNFGYPRVAYGTQYESMTWPLSSQQGRHEGYLKPLYAWVPSIGISQLIVLERDAFPYWRGDIMVSSLAAQTVFRVRVEDGRVILVEPIPIGHRIRDIVETSDGSIVLKTDDDFLVYLSPLDESSAETPLERGALLAAQCQACHSMTADGGNAIGPPLWNVVGREIASVEDFTYSEALSSADGRWTPDRLRSFLADPATFAPGTTMQPGVAYTEQQIEDLIAYLHTLR